MNNYKINDSIIIKQIVNNKYNLFNRTFPNISRRFGKIKIDNFDLLMLIDIFQNTNIGGALIDSNPKIDIYLKYNLKPKYELTWIFIGNSYRPINCGYVLFTCISREYKRICLKTDNLHTPQSDLIYYKKYEFKQIHQDKNMTYWYKD
jgi:hypothetical protein